MAVRWSGWAPAGRADRESEHADDDAEAMDAKSWSVTLAFTGDVHFKGPAGGPAGQSGRNHPGPDVICSAQCRRGRGQPGERPHLRRIARTEGARGPLAPLLVPQPAISLALLERSGVDAVSLANNHGADYGAARLRDSLRAGRNSPVAVIGVGRDPDQAFRPYQTSVDGVEVAVLAADASPLESNASIRDLGRGAPPGRGP
jgi:hypothetical protein